MESFKMITLLILAIICAVGSAQQSNCPTEYARFSTQHSFCLARSQTCSIIKEGVDENDKKDILQVHNDLRSKVAIGQESRAGGLPTASNMLQMDWDPELATIAQRWATQCRFEHDCGDCRTVENFYAGQNMAIQSFPPCSSNDCIKQTVKPDWKDMITMFYNEVSVYNKNSISSFQFEKDTGHLTQVIWAKSWRIGCGYVAYDVGNGIKKLYVCNYGPGGNIRDASVYEQGNPCSACPSNTCCGNCDVQGPTYSGLCKVKDQSLGPVYPERKNTLLNCDWRNENSPCEVKTSGKKDWKLKRSLSGFYTTIRLKGGEKSSLEVIKPVQPKAKNFCVVVVFRKGPSNAADKDSSSLSLDLKVPQWNWSTSMNLQMESKAFIPYSINIGWNAETQLTLNLSVPPNAPEHIFDIKDIIAYDGNC